MSAADEQQILSAAREGSRDAFRCLVERHMRTAYAVAYRFLHDHAAAEEVAQDAFVKVHQGLADFRGEASFSTWLYRIVVNLALNKAKQERRHTVERLDFQQHDVASDDASPLETLDIQDGVERALHELPTMQRAVVILRHMSGLSTKEVGRVLNCSEGTVKTHLFRGLEKMRQKLLILREEGI